ncbi:hypothetical protein ACN38_g449 [Penicillium nordicum]|uniref:Uncharacterized protein n=1 Tax=Penicillium nordicum TaxID=229535 RepID=A0A0M9WKR5_9EURO|nr:hypothetical protein ACN38_g449 [Penicillium nordicum]
MFFSPYVVGDEQSAVMPRMPDIRTLPAKCRANPTVTRKERFRHTGDVKPNGKARILKVKGETDMKVLGEVYIVDVEFHGAMWG